MPKTINVSFTRSADSPTAGQKQPPTHRSKGTVCNVVPDCGAVPALYVHGRFFGCAKHKAQMDAIARRSRGYKVEIPDAGFDPDGD